MKLYIAGPITGIKDFEVVFADAHEQLLAVGHEVENPCDNEDSSQDYSWEDYMKMGLMQMLACDGVAVLPDWEKSRGATIEVELAEKLGYPVKTVEEWAQQ